MSNNLTWRDTILSYFPSSTDSLVLVSDPDALFSEEKLVLELQARNFALLKFDDPVQFRYAYEERFHSRAKNTNQGGLIIISSMADAEFSNLPFDLVQSSRKLSFNLGALFPNLSYPVVAELDREFLDSLYISHQKHTGNRMGDNASRDFVLLHVFKIQPALIRNDTELLQMLLRLHYSGKRLPASLLERVITLLENNSQFANWALRDIVPDDKAFYSFLQERWPIFLEKLSDDTVNQGHYKHDMLSAYELRYAGPSEIPFGHEDIRVFIDNLFVEGKLRPVKKQGLAISANSWIRCGVIEEKKDDAVIRLERFLENQEYKIPGENAHFGDWISFALQWAELAALAYSHLDNKIAEKAVKAFYKLRTMVQAAFTKWITTHYAGLINQPPTRPTMLHHVPRFLARALEQTKETKIALIVIDGLALDQWVTVREELLTENQKLLVRESAVFAWIPTLTPVSRQALFAGKIPYFFKASIKTTSAEETLWRQFWENENLPRNRIVYRKALGSENIKEGLEGLQLEQAKIAGLVIDTVDNIMHGMQLGAAGMHNQIRQWCQRGFLQELIGYFLDHGYQIWLTSDHGNIECYGMGRLMDKGLTNSRGERARIYASEALRKQAAYTWPKKDDRIGTLEWRPDGLPDGYYPLLAVGVGAFAQKGTTIVSHGGISLEEVIVPFVKIERSK